MTHFTKSNGGRFEQQCLRALLNSAADLTSVDTASSRVMICGPRQFVRDMDKGCRELGLDSCNVVSFGYSDC
jgi:ferredoxin-NADP reductase